MTKDIAENIRKHTEYLRNYGVDIWNFESVNEYARTEGISVKEYDDIGFITEPLISLCFTCDHKFDCHISCEIAPDGMVKHCPFYEED